MNDNTKSRGILILSCLMLISLSGSGVCVPGFNTLTDKALPASTIGRRYL